MTLMVLLASVMHFIVGCRSSRPPTSVFLYHRNKCFEVQDTQNSLGALKIVLFTVSQARCLRSHSLRHSTHRASCPSNGFDRYGISNPLRRCLLSGTILAASCVAATSGHPALAVELSEEKQLIVDAWLVVQRAYVDPNFNGLDWKALRTEYLKRDYHSMDQARTATAEMLARLGDRYTKYFPPADYKYLIARVMAGEDDPLGLIGIALAETGPENIGIEVTQITDSNLVEADLRVGDLILAVDGKDFGKGFTVEAANNLCSGPAGSTAKIEYRHPNESGSHEIAVQRKAISLSGEVLSRKYSSAAGSVGVVTIPIFEEGSRWFSSLERSLEGVRDADRLVLDLRGNPGGHFPTGVDAARLFLPQDSVIVFTEDRAGQRTSFDSISDGPWSRLGKPLEILVDKKTGSAAEVFAAALQENGVAKLIGEVTFGKGVVQTLAKVSDGGAVKCTTARYITPKGNDINGVGIVPDDLRACPDTKQAADCI